MLVRRSLIAGDVDFIFGMRAWSSIRAASSATPAGVAYSGEGGIVFAPSTARVSATASSSHSELAGEPGLSPQASPSAAPGMQASRRANGSPASRPTASC